MLNIRPATRADAPVIASLVRELADYEKLLDEAKAIKGLQFDEDPDDEGAETNEAKR